jgi:hypothetical protein
MVPPFNAEGSAPADRDTASGIVLGVYYYSGVIAGAGSHKTRFVSGHDFSCADMGRECSCQAAAGRSGAQRNDKSKCTFSGVLPRSTSLRVRHRTGNKRMTTGL